MIMTTNYFESLYYQHALLSSHLLCLYLFLLRDLIYTNNHRLHPNHYLDDRCYDRLCSIHCFVVITINVATTTDFIINAVNNLDHRYYW